MTSEERKLMDEIQLSLPIYKYDNGIANAMVISHPKINLTLNDNKCLSITSYSSAKLTPSFINEVHQYMLSSVELQAESNKKSYYYERY